MKNDLGEHLHAALGGYAAQTNLYIVQNTIYQYTANTELGYPACLSIV